MSEIQRHIPEGDKVTPAATIISKADLWLLAPPVIDEQNILCPSQEHLVMPVRVNVLGEIPILHHDYATFIIRRFWVCRDCVKKHYIKLFLYRNDLQIG